MSRQGDVPFVAMRVGRSNDPREVLGLARELKVHRATALGYLLLWEELILEVGDARMGRVHGYTTDHLAAKLGWTGQPRKLVDAFKRAGVLSTHRGALVHPYWNKSTTGIYARLRADRREEWRTKKERQRQQRMGGDVPGDVSGTAGGRPWDNQGKGEIDRSIDRGSGASPPPPPPPAGGSTGFARWEWLRGHHRRPRNSQSCIRLLHVMPEESWALCQWVVELSARPWPRSLSRKKRVATLDSHRFLATEAFLELLPEWEEKLAREKRVADGPANGLGNVVKPDEGAAHLTAGIAFLLAQLADPELTEDEKQSIRARWAQLHPDNPSPWSSGQAVAQA